MGQQSLIYSFVARGTVVLAEFTGNFTSIGFASSGTIGDPTLVSLLRFDRLSYVSHRPLPSSATKSTAFLNSHKWVFLPSNDKDEIDKLNADLNSAADTLSQKTSENSEKIQRVFNTVRSALITVAALMFLLSLLGLVLSILGHKHAIHIFVVSGWLLVAVTFILCGVFVILNNAISDTCMAMGEWVDNPHAETALSNILPCVDQRTTNQTLIQSRQVINEIVNIVNQFIYTFADTNPPPQANPPYYYNQSGPSMPPLCYPYESQLQVRQCAVLYEVSMANASLDIMLNRSIKDALVAEEKFFRSRPVYSDLADRCGVPQLAKKLNQWLVEYNAALASIVS